MSVSLSFKVEVEKRMNVSNLHKISDSLLERMYEFMIGAALAEFDISSLFYKATLDDLLSSIISMDIYNIQVQNMDKLDRKVFLQNQVSVRVLIMGWYYKRGFSSITEAEQVLLDSSCANKLDFGIVEVGVY